MPNILAQYLNIQYCFITLAPCDLCHKPYWCQKKGHWNTSKWEKTHRKSYKNTFKHIESTL